MRADDADQDEGPASKSKSKRSSKTGIIRNKFKQMKSQEAINDYFIGSQQAQMQINEETE